MCSALSYVQLAYSPMGPMSQTRYWIGLPMKTFKDYWNENFYRANALHDVMM